MLEPATRRIGGATRGTRARDQDVAGRTRRRDQLDLARARRRIASARSIVATEQTAQS
jgi:hypothetical protein